MRITYDKIADAMYFFLKKGKISNTIPVSENLIIDLDQDGNTLGIELLSASSEEGMNIEENIARGVPIEIISDKTTPTLIKT